MTDIEFNPFQWPPNMTLAELHYNCCRPGIDKKDGRKCPCCNRQQKQSNHSWFLRSIKQDFKNYGGGIPAYFYLHIYFMVVFVIIFGVKVIYHTLILNQICPTLQGSANPCAWVFEFFYFCDHTTLYSALASQGRQYQATVLVYLQLATYLILVISTLGIKIFLYFLNKKWSLDDKLFSHYALVIKNVPLFYQLSDLQAELKLIDSSIEILEMFYLHKVSQYESSVRGLVDLYFQMQNSQRVLKQENADKFEKEYKKLKEKFMKLYGKYERQSLNLTTSSKKILVVFNTIKQKETIHTALKMNPFTKFMYYFVRLIGCKRESIGYFSERIDQPQEIHWKYIGESSTKKEKLRIETTLIGMCFMAIAFALLYFPMMSISNQKIENPRLGAGLGVLISWVIAVLALIFRAIIGEIMPWRKPSSKLAQNFFIVIAIAIFFFFFYVVSPAIFYFFTTSFTKNIKLGTFFTTILVFCLTNIVVNVFDLNYRTFSWKKNKLLKNFTDASKFCQGRLHEELTPPSFPIAFKLVVLFNIWTFNSYYIFQMPYLLGLFFALLVILYWINKYILYNHYRMQNYMSFQLQHKVQRTVLFIFQIAVTLGYFSVIQYEWQIYLIIGVFLTSVAADFLLELVYKRRKDQNISYDTDLKTALDMCKDDPDNLSFLNILEAGLKASFMLTDLDLSSASINTSVAIWGYQQTYNLYLSQFENSEVVQIIETQYQKIKKTNFNLSQKRQSELTKLFGKPLHQLLADAEVSSKFKKKDSSRKNSRPSDQSLGLVYQPSRFYPNLILKSLYGQRRYLNSNREQLQKEQEKRVNSSLSSEGENVAVFKIFAGTNKASSQKQELSSPNKL